MVTASRPPASILLPHHKHFRVNWSAAFGISLFYVYMLIPARLQERISVFTLTAPDAALAYGVGYPYLTALDVLMLAYVIFRGVFAKSGWSVKNWSVVAYVAAGIVCGLLLWVRFLIGAEREMFWDGPLAALRLIAIYGLFASIPSNADTWARRFQNALALLIVSSLLLNLAGFGNPDTPSNEAGRMNLSGLDFSTASYFGCALALSSLTLSTGRRQIVLFLCGLVGCVMGGGRNAILLFLICLFLLALLQRGRVLKAVVWLLAGLAAVAMIVVILFPSAMNSLPVFRRTLDDSVYYGSSVLSTNAALERFPFLEELSFSDPAIIGRFNTWASALQLLNDRGGMPLGSDWYVQQELKPFGALSHSHSAYLQALLKFGVLAIPIGIALCVSTWRGLLARSPYSMIVLFLLAGMVVDYWLLVIKASFLFFAFVRLNNDWVTQSRKNALSRLDPGIHLS